MGSVKENDDLRDFLVTTSNNMILKKKQRREVIGVFKGGTTDRKAF